MRASSPDVQVCGIRHDRDAALNAAVIGLDVPTDQKLIPSGVVLFAGHAFQIRQYQLGLASKAVGQRQRAACRDRLVAAVVTLREGQRSPLWCRCSGINLENLASYSDGKSGEHLRGGVIFDIAGRRAAWNRQE
ncbi:hypothetical protein EN792_065395 [Mesorhizobium sp. M00.F.Ca.ET.149.01.1.1]|nr:hypothetical protein EN792_065395 [Mesorhizobium sp. M00.F.Ca.ET.149.01.1.1]